MSGRPVRANVREVPEAGATFVLLPALADLSHGPEVLAPGATAGTLIRSASLGEVQPMRSAQAQQPWRGERRPAVAAARAGNRGRRSGRASTVLSASFRGDDLAPRDETDIPEDVDSAGSDARDDEDADEGAYYARFFLGSGFDTLERRSHGLMSDATYVIPLREDELWGDDAQERFLTRTFRLSSVVPVDGVRVEPTADDGSAESSFVVGVGGQVLRVSVKGAPAETEGFHRMELRLQRGASRDSEKSDPPIFATTLLVENGRVVVVGVPEPDEVHPGERAPRVAFLAVSPRFGELEVPRSSKHVLEASGEVEPPVLVDRVMPEYPREARRMGAKGKVVLQAVIRADGSVDGVQVLRLPDVPGSALLVEAAASAVREWRYLPARLHGEPVDVFFTVVVHFTTGDGD
jgi:TonB family protein